MPVACFPAGGESHAFKTQPVGLWLEIIRLPPQFVPSHRSPTSKKSPPQTAQHRPGWGQLFCGQAFNSGSPATLVSRLRTPARAAAEPTMTQFTSPSTAAVPMVAAAVCATVFSARTPAALIHVITFSLVLIIPPEN